MEKIQPSDISEEKGVTLLSLKTAALELGFTPTLVRYTTDEVLEYIAQTGDPVLIHDIKEGVGGHFSVIRSYDSETGKVELSDTEAGNIKYSVEDFRHIFTGAVLLINPSLSENAIIISDEEASAIWGMYVPVYMAVANSSSAAAQQASRDFVTCTNSAMKITNSSQRKTAREVCYTKLAKTLGDALSLSQESTLNTKFDYGNVNLSENDKNTYIGTSEILTALKVILNNQNEIITLQARITELNRTVSGTSLTSLNTQIAPINTKLSQAKADKQLLEQGIASKQSTVNSLTSDINNGAFISSGQLLLL